MTVTGKFEGFQYFNFETNFLKNENLFQKMEYLFLVEGTMVENTVFPYKTALSETNVKTNRVGVQNGPITNNRALSVTNTLKEETFVISRFAKIAKVEPRQKF